MSDSDPGELDPSRYYAVEDHVWVEVQDDSTVIVGIVADGCLLRGPIRHFSPRRVGKSLRAGLSCATLEGDDWVSPARSPVAGTVLEVNTAAQDEPDLVRTDCWHGGWLVRLAPEDLQRDRAGLVSGDSASAAFELLHAEMRTSA